MRKDAGGEHGRGGKRQKTGSRTGGGNGKGGSARTHVVNDYCQHYVDTGRRPSNFIRDAGQHERWKDYPHLQELMQRKDQLVSRTAHPPYFLQADLAELPLSVETFGTRFDAILIDPPWPEYARRAPGLSDGTAWSWRDIAALRIHDIAEETSFLWLWCGSAEGLEAGRHCLQQWGFRRIEDVCWIKTNSQANRAYLSATDQDSSSILHRTKEHCLMGIRGEAKRSVDTHMIHCNCDTDVIVAPEPPLEQHTRKPDELYSIVEHFCLGLRRLELFGEDHNIRRGWVTVGRALSSSNFDKAAYCAHFAPAGGGAAPPHSRARRGPGAPTLLPADTRIEELRPKSPPRKVSSS